jgi:hypothetical protein
MTADVRCSQAAQTSAARAASEFTLIRVKCAF